MANPGNRGVRYPDRVGSEHLQPAHSGGPAPRSRRPFLTARWSNLLLVSYHVPPDLLAPLLPGGCTLDEIEGRPAVSLVAFDFLGTRVKGVRWPGHVKFPEINLRYYVREAAGQRRRGVSFVRELVPRRLIAWSARWLYNEPYVACPMRSSIQTTTLGQGPLLEPGLSMHHEFRLARKAHTIRATAAAATFRPAPDSSEHWFKEHQWGFGRTRTGEALVYEVRHPHWDVHAVRTVDLDVDFDSVYGPQWAFLKDTPPIHFAWAVGSDIAVYPHGRM